MEALRASAQAIERALNSRLDIYPKTKHRSALAFREWNFARDARLQSNTYICLKLADVVSTQYSHHNLSAIEESQR